MIIVESMIIVAIVVVVAICPIGAVAVVTGVLVIAGGIVPVIRITAPGVRRCLSELPMRTTGVLLHWTRAPIQIIINIKRGSVQLAKAL